MWATYMHFADAVLAGLVVATGTMHWKETCAVALLALVFLQATLVSTSVAGTTAQPSAGAVSADAALATTPVDAGADRGSETAHARAHGMRNVNANPPASQVGRFMAAAALDFERENRRTDPHVPPSKARRAS